MSRGVIHQVVFIIMVSLLMIFGCASGYPTPPNQLEPAFAERRKGTIPVRVENNTFKDAAVYSLNGGVGSRIGYCAALRHCWLWINPAITTQIYEQGFITLGWRFFVSEPEDAVGPGTLSIWDGLAVVLTLNRINWFMRTEFFVMKQAE